MSVGDEILEGTAEELFEDAPCGYVSTRMDGTIVRVNRTFEEMTGLSRDDLVGARRFSDLLVVGARIHYETHLAPMLHMQGSVREIAADVVRADGGRLPALINAVVYHDDLDRPAVIRITVFDATERRRYELELLEARRREQEIAQRLQRSLLSGELPSCAQIDIQVAYRPAVAGLEVGGDWFDGFWLDESRRAAIVVGDVVGRGIDAATTMGQLRSAVRALAAAGQSPGELLSSLDDYARRHDAGRMATVAYAELDLATGDLAYACAGHPPPLLLEPGGPPEYLWDGRSLPLDAAFDLGAARASAHRTVAPGSTVLLYTDGLVERRARPLDDGMDLLVQAVAEHRGESPGALVASVVSALHDEDHPDDVCLLAAHRPVGG